MKKTVKLADVLWEAANERLTATYDLYSSTKTPFSCNAVAMAMTQGERASLHALSETCAILGYMGCSGSASALSKFSGQKPGSKALQGVRYMWLLLAMHVAEDEGIEVEVTP